MKILFLTPEYVNGSGGGIITYCRQIVKMFAAAGHEVRVVEGSGVNSQTSVNSIVIDEIRVETLDYYSYKRKLDRLSFLNTVPALARSLAASSAMWEQAKYGFEPDVVEACDWGLSFLPAVISSQQPVVVQAHGSSGQIDQLDPINGEEAQGVLTRLIETQGLRRAFEVQTSSNSNAQFWRRQTGREVMMIRPAWQLAAGPVESGSVSERGLVLGRVQDWKGPRVLCEALARMGARAPGVDWVGRDTVHRERGRRTSAALANEFPSIWGPRVRHLPQVPPVEAARLQRAARFNVVPSTWDVFNFTCVEAMASGRPVICSTGAGASELIEDGVNGFIFENGDAEALASAIDRAMTLSEKSVAQMSDAARKTIARELDPERIAAVRLRHYEVAIANFKPQPAPADDWLREVCSGREGKSSELAFLDHLPLKPLLNYTARRLTAKLTGRTRG